jgi:Na+/H+ antiporter NhaC
MSEPHAPASDGQTGQAASPTTITFRGGPAMSALPVAFFILWAIIQSGILRIGDTKGLVAAMLIGLMLGMLFVKGSWTRYAEAIFEGMTQKVVVTAIVAWLWAGMFADTLQVGGFVNGLGWLADVLSLGPALLPALTFLAAALLATGIGTGYGTTIAMVGLFFPAGVALGADPVLMFGAILSGAVFGDNLAPVSDTTIVSAVTQESDIGGVVASRFKYALLAAAGAFALYLLFGVLGADGQPPAGAQGLFEARADALGLVHILSMLTVIATAISGRHIIEAITWGLLVAIALNLGLGLCAASDILAFNIPAGSWVAQSLTGLGPGEHWGVLGIAQPGEAGSVSGSIYSGAAGFFTMSVLILLVIAGAQVMIRGGAFKALEQWLLRVAARTVRGGELTMVLSTALMNAAITINTAAEVAIAPYISTLGRRFNINGYRRANILDANTSALGYIFPWAGGVLVGFDEMTSLAEQGGTLSWFTESMVVNPADVWPWVFHGWLLVGLFVFSAWTGFGREYVSDRKAKRSAQI